MEPDARAVPPEQELTEALLGLSWPLPRTVGDADAALTRLEQVRAVLTRLERASVGTDAWWAGQVDALATQSGFVLEWWRPVLRDPDLDWTLNHQAHLTADLATLAAAGARLLDQLEPDQDGGAQGSAQHARAGTRAAAERRWGPTSVPSFERKQGAAQPPPRPQPPSLVFGDPAAPADEVPEVFAAPDPGYEAERGGERRGGGGSGSGNSAGDAAGGGTGGGKSGGVRGRLSGRKHKQPPKHQHQPQHAPHELPPPEPPRQQPQQAARPAPARPSAPPPPRQRPVAPPPQQPQRPQMPPPHQPQPSAYQQPQPQPMAYQQPQLPPPRQPEPPQRPQVPPQQPPVIPRHLIPQQPQMPPPQAPVIPQHLVPHTPPRPDPPRPDPRFTEPQYDEPRHDDARHEAPPPEGPQTAPRTPLPVDPYDRRRPAPAPVPEPEPIPAPEPARESAPAPELIAGPDLAPEPEPEPTPEPESGFSDPAEQVLAFPVFPPYPGALEPDGPEPAPEPVEPDTEPVPIAWSLPAADEPEPDSEPEFVPAFPPEDVALPGFPPEEPLSAPEPVFEPEPAPSAPIPAAFARPPMPQLQPSQPGPPEADPLAGARHRRPAYDFDSGSHLIAPAPPPAVFPPTGAPPTGVPQTGVPPRPASAGSTAPPRRLPGGQPTPRLPQDPYSLPAPGPRSGGPGPGQGSGPRPLGPGPGPGPGRGPVARPHIPVPIPAYDDDEDRSSDRLVPFGLRRHQRRLLMQSTAVVVAAGALCWWAVYTLGGHGHATNGAAAGTSHTPAASADAVPAASATGAASSAPATHQSSAPASSAPPAATGRPVDAAGITSVHVTLLGGSPSVPQIAVLISVTTDGTGQITVTGSYYGAAGSEHRTPETRAWTLKGQTSYSFSVPIANAPYCGTVFTFTADAGGRSSTDTTAPGC